MADGAAKQCILFQCLQYRVNEQPSRISSGGVPFLDPLYFQKNVQLIQNRSWRMGRFNFLALSRTDFQWVVFFFSPVEYNNGLCHPFKAAHVDVLFEIRCSEITLHNITCYWSEKQPVPLALCSSISAPDVKLTENRVIEKDLLEKNVQFSGNGVCFERWFLSYSALS